MVVGQVNPIISIIIDNNNNNFNNNNNNNDDNNNNNNNNIPLNDFSTNFSSRGRGKCSDQLRPSGFKICRKLRLFPCERPQDHEIEIVSIRARDRSDGILY